MEVSWNGVAQHGWFVMVLLKWMIWGTPILGNLHIAIEHGPFVVDLYIIPISIGDLA